MKAQSYASLAHELAGIARDPSAINDPLIVDILRRLSAATIRTASAVRSAHDTLLFISAYPSSDNVYQLAQRELERIVHYVRVSTKRSASTFARSGISGSRVTYPFSLEINAWLLQRGEDATLHQGRTNSTTVAPILNRSLDAVEYELSSDDGDRSTWLARYSKADSSGHLHALVNSIASLDVDTTLKEWLFGQLQARTRWQTDENSPGFTLGRAPFTTPFTHRSLQRRARASAVLRRAQPHEVPLDEAQKRALVDLVRGSLAMLERETDPSTYANVSEVRYVRVDRGVSVVLLPMRSDVKYALQSYIGYMAFKNGVPIAYGGGWLLFHESGFGVNVLEPFRGGESQHLVSQILAVYNHVFGAVSFTVDPYQLGFGNDDGIASGAFWFYYRLGFRPMQGKLKRLARSQWKKIQADHTYRSSKKVLEALAESEMRWTMTGSHVKPMRPDLIGERVTSYVVDEFHGDRRAARKDALQRLRRKTGMAIPHQHPAARIAVVLAASGAIDTVPASALRRFVQDYEVKRDDEVQYVRLSQRHTKIIEALHTDA